jgi:hypothetical protein
LSAARRRRLAGGGGAGRAVLRLPARTACRPARTLLLAMAGGAGASGSRDG